MCGLILEKYKAMDGPRGSLGMPTSNEKVLPDQVGRVSVFEHGSIYWSPSSDAHPIWGRIGDKWGQKGWEGGFLHYPTSDELRNPDGRGLHQTFQGGSIYYSPETDAHSIGGLIGDKWGEKGWEGGTLGYPTTDETGTKKDGGAFNHFQRGSIYWSPGTGAHAVWGEIRNYWASHGWENSSYGYPATDEFDADGGKKQNFQGAPIAWRPSSVGFRVLDSASSAAMDVRIASRVAGGQTPNDAAEAEYVLLVSNTSGPDDGGPDIAEGDIAQGEGADSSPAANPMWTIYGSAFDKDKEYMPIRKGVVKKWGYDKVVEKHNVKLTKLIQWVIQNGTKTRNPKFGGPDYDADVIGRDYNKNRVHVKMHMGTDESTRRDEWDEDSPDGKIVGMVTTFCPEETGTFCPDVVNDRTLYKTSK
ncbi:LGFP repeat-containing protein [Rhodococcus jostii]|uniref:LGFP repeat-containing protein n=1 Tax=Rhodococcus jostii TaxID=132919 RepID=UPI0036390327